VGWKELNKAKTISILHLILHDEWDVKGLFPVWAMSPLLLLPLLGGRRGEWDYPPDNSALLSFFFVYNFHIGFDPP